MYEGTRVKLFVQNGSTLEGTILFVDSHIIKLKDVKHNENPPRFSKELSLKASDLKDLQILLPEGTPTVNSTPSSSNSTPKPTQKSQPNAQNPSDFKFPPPPSGAPSNEINTPAWNGKNDNVLAKPNPPANVNNVPHHVAQPPPSNMVMTPPIHHHGSPVFHPHHLPFPPQPLPPQPPLVDPAIVSMSGNAPRMQAMPLSHIPIPNFNGVSQMPPPPLQPINLNDLLPQFAQQQEESLKQAPLPQVQPTPQATQSPKKVKKSKENSPATETKEKKPKSQKKKSDNSTSSNQSNNGGNSINYFNMNDVLNSITADSVANTKHLEPGEIQVRNPSPSKRQQPLVNVKKISKADKSTFVQKTDGTEIDEDFDFVGNNAKFDKKEVYSQMLSEVNFSEAPTEEAEEVPEDKVPKKNFTLESDKTPVSAVTSVQMKNLFSYAIQEGISTSILIENAGRNLCDLVLRKFLEGKNSEERGKFRVVVLVGVGNTGCVGLSASRHLANRNVNVIISRSRAYQLSDESVNQRKVYQSCNGGKEAQLGSLPVEKVDLIIDALIGVGLRGVPVDPTATLIQWANANGAPILSVDVPSGVDGTTGEVTKCAIKANYTLALGLPKTGLNEDQAGELWLCDTGMPGGLVAKTVQNQPNFGSSFLVKLRY